MPDPPGDADPKVVMEIFGASFVVGGGYILYRVWIGEFPNLVAAWGILMLLIGAMLLVLSRLV